MALFGLSEVQLSIQEMARGFAAAELAPHAVAWDRDGYFPIETLRRAAALGMAAINITEKYGGSGLGRLDSVLIMEALATGCPSIAGYISVHNMVGSLIDRFGAEAQRARFLPPLVSMEVLASYCLTEPGAGSDAAALTTSAKRDGDGWVIDGVKQFISGAGTAGLYLLMARSGGPGAAGISAFLIEKGVAGLSFGPEELKMGWRAQPTRQVICDGVRVGGDALLGNEGEGFRIAMSGLDAGRLNIAACSLGGASSAFEKSVAYLGQRRAFERNLSEFQGLQFRIAEMETKLTAARLMVWQAAAKLDAGEADASRHAAMAKLCATDAGFEVANQALQLLGGYGYLCDFGIEKLVRDLRVHQILEGTNEIMRVVIARKHTGKR